MSSVLVEGKEGARERERARERQRERERQGKRAREGERDNAREGDREGRREGGRKGETGGGGGGGRGGGWWMKVGACEQTNQKTGLGVHPRGAKRTLRVNRDSPVLCSECRLTR